jgi:CheY-like chemotaxis protein
VPISQDTPYQLPKSLKAASLASIALSVLLQIFCPSLTIAQDGQSRNHNSASLHINAKLVAAERFDGMFVDLEMPKVHRFELVRRIRQSSWNQSTPIIIVTGSERPAAMKLGFKAGGSFFLQKPIERYKLLRLPGLFGGACFRIVGDLYAFTLKLPLSAITQDELQPA